MADTPDDDNALWLEVSRDLHQEASQEEIAEEVRRRKLTPEERAAEDKRDREIDRTTPNKNRGGGWYNV